jgi:neutral ceramidase
MKLHWILAVFLCSLMIPPRVQAAETGQLRVGAAKVDISPPASMFPIPSAFSQGQRPRRNFVGVHDPIYVRALVLDNGFVQAAIVTVDVGTLTYGQEFSKQVSEAIGIPTDRILLAPTHNHCAPYPGPITPWMQGAPKSEEFKEFIGKQMLEAVRAAKAKLQPARMGYGTGNAYINANRDEKVGSRYTYGYNPDGPSEKTVYLLKFESPSGEPIAFLMNYAVHAVVMFDVITKDGGMEVTGDIPGATSRYLEKHYQDKPVALWTSGAAGDQNPIYMALYNQNLPDRTDLGASGYALLEVQSRRLGEEAVRISDRIKADASNVPIWGGKSKATCPGGRVTRVPNSDEIKLEDAGPVELQLQALTINDVALTGVNGEAVSLIGQHVKKSSPYAKTIFINHTGPSAGYIPDDASYPKVTNEVTSSIMKPGCAENAIVDGLVKLLKLASGGRD